MLVLLSNLAPPPLFAAMMLLTALSANDSAPLSAMAMPPPFAPAEQSVMLAPSHTGRRR